MMKALLRASSLLTLLVVVNAAIAEPVPAKPAHKKIITFGWGAPDTKYVREHWQEMEQMPLDGVTIQVAIDPKKPTIGDGASANMLGYNLLSPRAFKLEDYRFAIEDLKSAKWRKFTDNFLLAAPSTGFKGDLNWFDDARWKIVENNWRVLATIAKEGGCKGILFDPEAYEAQPQLFSYKDQRAQRVDRPFAEYLAKARQRGRQLMTASRQIYPDMTMFCIFAHTLPLHYQRTIKGMERPEDNYYALLPAFLDGMLEASDMRAQWLDGWEFSYGYKNREQFLDGYHTVLNKVLPLSSVPDVYRARMRVGFGLWIDNDRRWDATDFSKNYFSPAEFRNSLQMALEVSDEYVWIYTEKLTFFPRGNLPDEYLDAIKAARETAG